MSQKKKLKKAIKNSKANISKQENVVKKLKKKLKKL